MQCSFLISVLRFLCDRIGYLESNGDACEFLGSPLLIIGHELASLQDGGTVPQCGVSISTDKALIFFQGSFDTLPEEFVIN